MGVENNNSHFIPTADFWDKLIPAGLLGKGLEIPGERTLGLTWKRVLAPCNRAGLRGATGLRVLQKWMLESRGLGVSRMGV